GRLLVAHPHPRQRLGLGRKRRGLVTAAGAVDQLAAVRRDHVRLRRCGRLRHQATASSFSRATKPSCSSCVITCCADCSGVRPSVSTTISACSGASYGSETPVNSLISPEKAFAY